MALGDGQLIQRARSYITEPVFANVDGMTPEAVARRRALAQALWDQGQSSEPVTSIFGGLNKMLQSFLAGHDLRAADNADANIAGRERDAWSSAANTAFAGSPAAATTTPGMTAPTAPTGLPTRSNAASQGFSETGLTGTSPEAGVARGIDLLAGYEGFSGTPYEDWSYRPGTGERYMSGYRNGYGQTATADAAPITEDQARQQLAATITNEYIPSIVGAIGADAYSAMTPDQQGVLISLVHNYGSLPGRIIPALQSGDPAAIGQAIAGLANDNNGINANRRNSEAAYFASPGAPGGAAGAAAGQAAGTPGPGANPALAMVQQLLANPATFETGKALVLQQIQAMTAAAVPGDDFTLGANDVRFDDAGNVIARNPGTGGADFVERPLTAYERQFYQIPANSQQVWVMTANGPEARGSGGPQTVIAGPERAYDAGVGTQDAAFRGDIYKGETDAIGTMNTLDAMEGLIRDPSFYSGVGAGFVQNLRQFGAALGITDPNAAVNMENFAALAARATLDSIGGSLGTGISNADRDMIRQMVANPTFTPAGNLQLITIHRAIAQRKLDLAEMARQYTADPAHPRLDDGFRRIMAQYAADNPLFPDGALPGVAGATPPPAAGTAGTITPGPTGQPIYTNPHLGITITPLP